MFVENLIGVLTENSWMKMEKKIIRYTIIVIPYVMSIDNFPQRKK